MSDNQYIKKQQRARNKSLITTRHILILVLLSVAIYAGFYFEYGIIDDGTCEGTCENLHTVRSWVLGFIIMFGVIIAAGALIGGLVSFLKWNRNRKGDTLSTLLDNQEKK